MSFTVTTGEMKKLLIATICVSFYMVAVSNAATPPVPTAQERNDPTASEFMKSLKPLPSQLMDERDKKPPKINIEAEKKDVDAVSDAIISFTTFTLQGSTLLVKSEIEAIITPFIGEKMTISQLQRLADIITKLYEKKGYGTSYCFIPPQTVTGGKIVFQCVEPRIGKLIVKNAEEYNEKLFSRFLRPLQDKPLNTFELAERLKSFSLMPTFFAVVEIKRTDRNDIVDLYIQLNEKAVNPSEIYVDNYGSRYSGRERVGGLYNVVNVTGYGDILNLHVRTSMDTTLSHAFSLSYKRLINNQGGLLSLSGGYNDYEVDKDYISSNLRSSGNGTNLSVNYKHPLMVKNNVIVTGNLLYDFKDVTSKTILTASGDALFDKEDATHVFAVGTDIESVDGFGGWNSLGFSVSRGVEGFFDGMRKRDTTWTTTFPIKGTIREGVKPDFTLLMSNYYRRQNVQIANYGFEYLVGLYGQYTRDRLPSSYTFADGDYGYHAILELRLPVLADVLKISSAFNYENYFNSSKTRDLVGVSSESASWVTSGIMGHIAPINADYSLMYSRGVSGQNSRWEDYRNSNKLNFLCSIKF